MRRPGIPLALALALAVSACGSGVPDAAHGIRAVAAENFWGSIAAQLAGRQAGVQSIITNPAVDPHSYEPTAGDARTLATAQFVLINGVGYDPWAQRLLSASPASGRIVLDVGHLLGLRQGENPHRWYDPADVKRVAQAITADLQRLHPQARNGYRRRYDSFLRTGLAPYDRLIAAIRDRYAGVAIGASESIFAPLSAALGLRLITPASFMNAISEGSEVSAQDVLRTQRQITSRQIKVWIYNAQNATPAIQHLNSLARAQHIPIVTITETLSPATASFEQWQVTQLERLRRALRDATGR